MKLLFLHPMPGLGWQQSYLEACSLLRRQREVTPVFAYTGAPFDTQGTDIPVYHFDSWLAAHRMEVEGTSLAELERRYRRSALWLGAVSERLVTNYSLLHGAYRTVNYSREEVGFLVVAIVLFFQAIFDQEDVDAVLAHHPDNIFSMLAFEMCESLPQVPFLMFPDYYWDQDRYLLFDTKFFTSRHLEQRYRALLAEYEGRVAPRLDEVAAYVEPRLRQDPASTCKHILPTLSVWRNVRNAMTTLRTHRHWITLRRPPVESFHRKLWLPVIVRAFLVRQVNLLRHGLARIFSDELPEGPIVYLPLQRVPEAAMLTRATGYLNQLSLVQTLSASLPATHTLVVKDHPRSRGFSSLRYYREMAALPNVRVLRDTCPNALLLERADLVITIGGTIGLQTLMRGGSILMFGRKFYEFLEGVMRVSDLNDLPHKLKEILIEGRRPDPERCRRSIEAYVLAVLDCSYTLGGGGARLHQSPEMLAGLVSSMITREVRDLVEEKRCRFGTSTRCENTAAS